MTTQIANIAATRRIILAAALAGGGALVGGGAQAAPALDLITAKGKLRAFMLMRGALDDRLVVGFVSGRYYGVVDEEIKPLYGVVGATFARYRPRADGGYDGASYEVPFFTDLETGAALDRWHNPYTNEVVDVSQAAYPPAAITITPDLEVVVPKPPPGLVARDRVVSMQTFGQDVWATEETVSAFTIPGAPKPIRYSEVVILHASSEDFQPGAARVPCQNTYTSIVSWRPWLKMGDRPGHLLGNGVGGYGVTLDALPENWRAAAAARRPDVLKDPAGPLAKLL